MNVIGKARLGERYVFISRDGDWAKIEAQTESGEKTEGYINVGDGNEEAATVLYRFEA